MVERARSLSHKVTGSMYISLANVQFSCFKEGWRDGKAPLHDCLSLPCHPSVKLFQVPASDRFPVGLAFESLSLLIMRIASLVAALVGDRFWTHFLTFFCGVRSFTFTDLRSLPGDLLLVRKHFSPGYVHEFCPMLKNMCCTTPQRDGEALPYCLYVALSPQCVISGVESWRNVALPVWW